MVYIEIDDDHPLHPVEPDGLSCSNGNVVEKAEAHGLICSGMMTRGPDTRKSGINLTGKGHLYKLDNRSGGIEGNRVGIFGTDGVGVEVDEPLGGTRSQDLIDI